MESFEHLQIWQREMDLIQEIYQLTKLFPHDERFGLVAQMRRSVTSILANTAEGLSRTSPADKAHKYTIARGECTETYAFVLIGIALSYITSSQAHRAMGFLQETGKMLSSLIRRYSSKEGKTSPNPNPNPVS